MVFIIGNYEFSFNQNRISVDVSIKKLDGADVEEDDKKNIKAYLEDMGKWETVLVTIRNILDEIGITGLASRPKSIETYQAEFGELRYDIELYQNSGSWNRDTLKVNIDLKHKERERLRLVTKASPGQDIQLSKDEVEQQVKNVLKWRSLNAFLSWIR